MFADSERRYFLLFLLFYYISEGGGSKFLASGHDLRGSISHFDACLCGAPGQKKAFHDDRDLFCFLHPVIRYYVFFLFRTSLASISMKEKSSSGDPIHFRKANYCVTIWTFT